MATNAATGDGEAELLAIRAIALAGVEVDPGRTQPADCQILELVADLEDPQRLTAEIRTVVLGRAREFELQGPFAGMAQPGCAEIGSGWRGLALGDERAAYLRAELEEIEEEAQREARAEERDPDARLEARLDAKALSDAADRVRLAGYDDDGGYEDASYDERDADFVRSLDDEEEG